MSTLPSKDTLPRQDAGETFRRVLGAMGPLLILLFLALLLMIFAPAFRKPSSISLVLLEVAAIALVSAAQTFVILTSGIDLSVEGMVSFSGVIAAILIAGTNVSGGQIAEGLPAILAVIIAIGGGLLVGLLQGLIIVGLNINPFIVTLGFRGILWGTALVLSRGAGIYVRPDAFLSFLISGVSIGTFKIPMPFIIAVLIYLACWIILRQTRFGRYTYAIGGNETASRLSGVAVNRVKIFIYGISGFLSAIAGILVMARLQSGAYQNGTNMTLSSVAAVVIGGTALSGGVGGIWGTLVGVFIIRLVEQALVYLGVQSSYKEIVIGVVIIIAVALDVLRRGEIPWLKARVR